jgi:hypothetical protein
MFRITATLLFIFGCATFCLALDTVKKKSAVSPYSKYKSYKYHAKAVTDSNAPLKADTAANPPVVDKGLNGQFQYLLTKVYHYQQPLISAMWKNASDTLQLTRKKLKASNDSLAIKTHTVDSLNLLLTGRDQNNTTAADRATQMSLLGIYVSKTTYNIVVWGLIIVLGVTAFVVISQSASYRRQAKEKTQLYSELEEEFKTYKAKANDKEKKLARELQTERNKLDELLGR